MNWAHPEYWIFLNQPHLTKKKLIMMCLKTGQSKEAYMVLLPVVSLLSFNSYRVSSPVIHPHWHWCLMEVHQMLSKVLR